MKNRRRLNIGEGAETTTILVIEDYTDNKGEAKANAILLSQSKEMAKSLQDILHFHTKHYAVQFAIPDEIMIKAREVLNKALNLNP